MDVADYISKQPEERRSLLEKIHSIILAADKTVTANIGMMMGKQGIIYNTPGMFKYSLVSAKNYMSLHVMPIYGAANLHAKYKALLPQTNFQKACINFNKETEMPLNIIKEMISECASIDLMKIREEYLKNKKARK